jgi:hypothetical protein
MARGDLEEVLAALVVRARHAISGAGRIVIETRDAAETNTAEADNAPSQRGVIIQLTDTGAGIDANTRAGLEYDQALGHDVAADNRVPLLVGRAGGRVSVECDAVLGTTAACICP